MPPICRLYLITPPRLDDVSAFAQSLEAALGAADVAALQLRFKSADDLQVEAAVSALQPLAQAFGVATILNDRPDLAARLGCDGVHVGQSDASCTEARRLVGPDLIVGVTCHDSRHLGMEACEHGADYVAFGAFYDTSTKTPDTRAEPELLTVWQETMTTPCVAIGGITVDTARGLARAGADFIAVCAGVWSHPAGPAEAVRRLNEEIAAGVAERDSLALP